MKRRIVLSLAITLVMGVVGTTAAVADDTTGGGATYLALGDSVAAGTQQPAPFTSKGYTDRLYRYLINEHGFDSFVNLACPGDDTVEMRFGEGGASPTGSLCYGPTPLLPPGGTSQLDTAVAYLTSHVGEVGLITITIGANDILACDPNDPPDEVNACLAAQFAQIGDNLPAILGALRAAAPGVPIVGMNYYQPNLAFWLVDPALAELSLAATRPFNETLHQVYAAFDVPVANVQRAFRTFSTRGTVPKNVRYICRFTLMCERQDGTYVLSDYDPVTAGPQTDIHPSNKGYRKIARTFIKVIENRGLVVGY